MVAIIGYGVGNLFSLEGSPAAIGWGAMITGDQAILWTAGHMILLDVGAFSDTVARLRAVDMAGAALKAATAGKPVLDICLGAQFPPERSLEYGEHPGLGLTPGEVCPIRGMTPAGLAVPRMGWSVLRLPVEQPRNPTFVALEKGERVYSVHSYAGFACGGGSTVWTKYDVPPATTV